MARKTKLAPHVIEVKLEQQPPSEPSDEEEEISQDEDESEEDEEENNEVEDEEEEDLSSKESIRKLLEPFGKEQLTEIFKEAVARITLSSPV
ncbi:hypothetical protein MA16_Dca012734 [Dendrobium catenatum]|uniref:Uncharacterized protein n=1 Tax=Dendrobium catenatum TaxID=906689 RepID=A0A2I0V7M5_9ASPA|nr:hypothetical protein MA16_Dca012734 [Dendrobium catenatum]